MKAAIFGAVLLSGSWVSAEETTQTAMLMRLPGMSASPASVTPPTAEKAPALPVSLITNFTNYPNPFDSRKSGMEGKTEIAFSLSTNSHSTLTIYDLLGQKVLEWSFNAGDNGGRAGLNTLLWDGTNERGQKVSKGGYIAQLEIDTSNVNATAIRKIGLIH